MYSNIANHFDKTRSYVWNCVKEFLSDINPDNKLLLEAGCGNGKNLLYSKSIGFEVEGYDNCFEFVNLCCNRGLNCFEWDIRNPIEKQYDIILCIAVIHHLQTEEERLLCLQNLFNILKSGGKMLLTFWSYETILNNKKSISPKIFNIGDNMVPWKTCKGIICSYRYYYIYDENSINNLIFNFKLNNQTANVFLYWEEQNWILKINKL